VFTNPSLKGGGTLMIVMNTTFKSASSSVAGDVVSASATDINLYAGKYKMTGLPFEYIVITTKDGKVIMDANGQAGELKQIGSDTFDADGKAKIIFVKDDKNTVTKLKMEAMGFNFEGDKE
jgi:cytochrome c